MPSFLSKVFRHKKDEKDLTSPTSPATEKRSSAPNLLEGRHETGSPNVSPSAAHFPDNARLTASQGKDSPLGLFRPRSKNVDQSRKSNANDTLAPHLTLNLPIQRQTSSRTLDVVFESATEESGTLDVGERRLSPAETLRLIQACSSTIIEHGGLEALGLMHPHWYAASDEVQQRLISLFLLSLGTRSSIPASDSSSTLFDSELKYTRSTHDVAAVLRWGLRHLKLEGSSFGKDASEWDWYATFATSEREAGFPSAAFSKTLMPSLPTTHVQLLTATLEFIEFLAAHAEANGSSGSKLAKLFGFWLVSTQRARRDEDWAEFYKRWETAGRVLEHLVLAHIREESSLMKMPLRLSELVKQYPYGTASSAEKEGELPLLISPRFSTRRYEALFVRLETTLPTTHSPLPARKHPLDLLSDALKAKTAGDAELAEDVVPIWKDIKAQASKGEQAPDDSPTFTWSQILDDETLRILSLVPNGQSKPVASTKPKETAPPTSPILRSQPHRRRSSSFGAANRALANGHSHDSTAPPTDWADFSKLGFGESNLDQGLNLSLLQSSPVAITSKPPTPPSSVAAKRRRASSPGRGRRSSLDNPGESEQRGRIGAQSTQDLHTLVKRIDTVTVDEVFFDFWSDALLDPIAADWPTFVVCQLKPSAWKYNLLIVEQTFTRPAPPPLPPIPQFETTSRRASSPKPSLAASSRGRRSFNFSPTIKRFSIFSSHNTSTTDVTSKTTTQKGKSGSKAPPKSPQIGEMGEILSEEAEPQYIPAKENERPKEPTPNGPEPALTKPTDADKHKENKNDAAAAARKTEESAAPAPTDLKENEALPPVPLVDVVPTEVTAPASDVPPAAIEPVKTEEEAPRRPSIDTSAPVSAPTEGRHIDHEKQLPPAPETVVLTGSTPGPQVALETSEPVAIAHAHEDAASAVAKPAAQASDTVVDDAPIPPAKDNPPPVAAAEPTIEPVTEESIPDTAKDVTDSTPALVSPPAVSEPAADEAVSSPEISIQEPEAPKAPLSEPSTQAKPVNEEVPASEQHPALVADDEEPKDVPRLFEPAPVAAAVAAENEKTEDVPSSTDAQIPSALEETKAGESSEEPAPEGATEPTAAPTHDAPAPVPSEEPKSDPAVAPADPIAMDDTPAQQPQQNQEDSATEHS